MNRAARWLSTGSTFSVVMACGSLSTVAHASGQAVRAVSEAIAPPATRLETTSLLSPTAARDYFGSSIIHTVGVSLGATAPPEVVELARSLRAGRDISTSAGIAAFATAVLDYVRNNIRTELRYGLSKGGRGALIDQSGTAFDQAELMAMLLRQEGIAVSYVSGDVAVTPVQFGKWTNMVQGLTVSQSFTVPAKAACQLLADGAIPAIVNGVSDCTSLTGNMSSLTVSHIWLNVDGEVYDPSFKVHLLRKGIDVPAAMGCGTRTTPTCGSSMSTAGMSGASTGTTQVGGIAYLENYNYAGAIGVQNAYTDTLLTYIRTQNVAGQGVNASVIDVLGGKILQAQSSIVAPLTYTGSATWAGAVPDQFRTRVTVRVLNTCASFYADEIATSALSFTRGGIDSTSGYAEYVLDGVLVSTLQYVDVTGCSALTVPSARIVIDHPYAASAGTYADFGSDFKTVDPPSDETGFARRARSFSLYIEGGQGVTPRPYATGSGFDPLQRQTDWPEQNYLAIGPINFVLKFGQSGPSGQKFFNDLNSVNTLDTGRCNVLTTTELRHRRCNTEDLPVIGASYASLRTLADDMIDGINRSVSQRHHDIGVIFSGRAPGLVFMSIQESVSIAPVSGSTIDRKAAFDQTALMVAEVESRANSVDSAQGVSAARSFFNPYSLGTRIYDITPAQMPGYVAGLPQQDYATVSGATRAGHFCISYMGYSGPPVGQPGCWRHLALQDIANAGYSMLMREGGIGQLSYSGDDSLAFTVWEYLKGAATVPDPYAGAVKTTDIVDPAALRRKFLAVSAGTGDYKFTAGADLITGAGEFPESLPFIRTHTPRAMEGRKDGTSWYNTFEHSGSLTRTASTAIRFGPDALYHDRVPGGWTHNYQIRKQLSNDLSYQLGSENAQFAVELISSLEIVRQMKLNGSLQSKVASIAAISNIYRTITGETNTVIIKRGDQSTSFHLVRNVLRSSEEPLSLITPNSYIGADGQVISFSPYRIDNALLNSADNTLAGGTQSYGGHTLFKADSWIFPSGLRLDFEYSPMPLAKFEGCNPDDTLLQYWGNYGWRLDAVRNNLGRRLAFSYAAEALTREYAELGCRSLPGGVTYQGLSGGVIWGAAGPGASRTLTYHLSGVSDENGRSISLASGLDSFGQMLTVTDPLLGVTRYSYGAGSDSPNPATIRRNGFQLRRWFTPRSSTTPYQTIKYDGLFRTSVITDRNGNTTSYYPTGLFGSEFWKQSKLVDGTGSSVTQSFDVRNGEVYSADGVGNITRRTFDNSGRLLRMVAPGGGAVEHTYDLRGNELTLCTISATRAGQVCNPVTDIVTRATFVEANSPDCGNRIVCARPASSTDALGAITEYSWSAATGQLLSVLKPPVFSPIDGVTVRPSTTLTYTTLGGVSFLTRKLNSISAGQSVGTSYGYDAANKYVLQSVVTDDVGLQLRSCLKYDGIGNLISKTDPQANLRVCP